MKTTLHKNSVVSRRLAILLEELNEECAHVQQLIAQLKLSNLNSEQVEEILSELNAAVVHLNAHTANLDQMIAQEMDDHR